MAEMVVAAFLTSLLGLLIGTAVVTFVRPVVEIDGRTRLAIEARLAAESLAQDLSGYLADPSEPGDLSQFKLVWPPGTTGRLSLTYTAGPAGGPVVVSYIVDGNKLLRLKTIDGVEESVCIARHVSDFSPSMVDGDSAVSILLTFTYPDAGPASSTYFSSTYKLVGVKPPS